MSARRAFRVFGFVAAALCAALSGHARAQQHNITIDGRFSPAQALTGPEYRIDAGLGKQVGGNLFQSFGKFGLVAGENATFSGPAGVSNIIGRVTGGAASNVDGRITSTIQGANLYLVNPSGMVFGPNASVNVSGGFHVSTADYIKMSDGAHFQATNPSGSTLSAAPPAAFGFMTATPATLTINGSRLGVPSGDVSIVGGPVSIAGARISAPGGTVRVAGTAGQGEIPLDPNNTAGLSVSRFAPVNIIGGSQLDVSDPAGRRAGSVAVRAGALTVDASEINADNASAASGRALSLVADDFISLSNSSSVHAVTSGSGSGGAITLATGTAGVISINHSVVQAATKGTANGGALSIATGSFTLSNTSFVQSSAAEADQSLTITPFSGSAGPLTLTAATAVINNSLVQSRSGNKAGGSLNVTIGGMLSIDGRNSASANKTAGIDATAYGAAKAGNVSVSTGGLSLTSNGVIESNSRAAGDSGNVSVTVAGPIVIDATAGNHQVVTGVLTSNKSGSGKAGDVTVAATGLSLLAGGSISANTTNQAAGGNVSVTVAGPILLDAAGSMSKSTISASSVPGATAIGGPAGSISVTAQAVSLIGSTIASDAQCTASAGCGNGGDIRVTASGNIDLTASTVEASSRGSGNAGGVSLAAQNITLQQGALVGSLATCAVAGGCGQSGAVTVVATGDILLVSGGSDLSSISSVTTGAGATGPVSLSMNNLTLRGGSFINADADCTAAAGCGGGGQLSIKAAGDILVDTAGGASPSTISAQTLGSANAGAISVSGDNLTFLSGGRITSTSFGSGAAGDIVVAARRALTLELGRGNRGCLAEPHRR